jgi:hypothetical protein
MNKSMISEEKLSGLLKEDGLENTTEIFSDNLSYFVIRQQRKNKVTAFNAGSWIGKLILGMLVFFNLLIIYRTNIFSTEPVVFISGAAFVVGIWGVIALTRRFQV